MKTHFAIRDTVGAAKYAARHTGKILVTFQPGTAGRNPRNGAIRRLCKPQFHNTSAVKPIVIVQAFKGLWEVGADCFQFESSENPGTILRQTNGRAMKAQISFDAVRHIAWLDEFKGLTK